MIYHRLYGLAPSRTMNAHRNKLALFVSCTALLSTAGLTSLGLAKIPEVRLAPADASIGARVGASVAADKDTVVLGAPDDDEGGPFAGAIYVYARHGQTWQKQTKLLGRKTDGFRSFGEAVALSGNALLVGAPFDGPAGDASGAAYVYARSGKQWIEQARLVPKDSAPAQLFGDAVAIDENTAVVGAFLDSERAPNAGAVYVFKRNSSKWIQTAKLTASDASEYGFFGSALAVKGLTIVVGSPIAQTAYVFTERDGRWIQQAILTASDASFATYTSFGAAVATDGATIVIGAPTDAPTEVNMGSVYVFRAKGQTWIEQSKLSASDAAGGDEFGTSVAIDGAQLAVGSPYHDGSNNGALYVFAQHGSTWRQQELFTGHPPTAFLGSSVSLVGKNVVGGAPAFVEYNGRQSAGAGYIYRVR